MCGKIKGGLSSFNIYNVNLKFVCFGSQRGSSSHVQMQCQLNKRAVVRYLATRPDQVCRMTQEL